MGEPIRIETESPEEARDLVEALAVRGFSGRVPAGSSSEVEVRYEREETGRLLADLSVALETWLEDRGRDVIALRVADRPCTVRTHQKASTAPTTQQTRARGAMSAAVIGNGRDLRSDRS